MKLKLLQPHEGHPAGDVIEVAGGVASVLMMRRIGVMLPACEHPEEPAARRAYGALAPLDRFVVASPPSRVRAPKAKRR